jgi:hypothetical protein
MTVHKAISAHSKNQATMVATFKKMETNRELAIEQAIQLARNNEDFSVHEINEITKDMNAFRKQVNFELPERKLVTKEMVIQYVKKRK